MKTIQEFHVRLRAYIDNGKIKQVHLARSTGVPQYAISRFLSGRDLPGRYLIPLLAAMQPSLPPSTSAETMRTEESRQGKTI